MKAAARWNFLKKDDVIDLVAPSSGATDQTLNQIVLFLEEIGLKPRVSKDLKGAEFLSSNTDDARARHLIAALHDVHSKAVWCIKNGYGAGRILPYLAKINKPLRPKLFIGASDSTPIHLLLNHSWKWSTLYGPTLDKLISKGMSAKSLEELIYIIRGKKQEIHFEDLKPLNEAARVPSTLNCPVIGGHLSKISLTLGTTWSNNPAGSILFLDEASARAHEIDSYLEHLIQSGYLSKLKAVIFGSFFNCNEPNGDCLWGPVIDRFAASAGIPVLTGILNIGANFMRVIPFGAGAELVTGVKGRLSISTGGMGEGTSSSIQVA